jgi:enoyl-CoA hydratase/carnithine racemase
MTESDIITRREGPVGWITIDRPERMNALLMSVTDRQIVAALHQFEAEPDIRAIVITGSGDRAFCTGWDMEGIEATDLAGLEALVRRNLELFTTVRCQRQPVIAAINGHAVATGAALAMTCDLVVASQTARLAEPEIRHGALSPFLIMPWLTHSKAVNEFYLLGDPIDAAEMHRLGLANRVVPPEALVATAQRLAERLALVPREPLEMKKRSLRAAQDLMGLAAGTERHALADTLMIGADLPHSRRLQDLLVEQGMRAFLEARDGPFRAQPLV